MLGIRLIGPLLQRVEAARLARTLGTSLSNGVALLQALVIARQVCTQPRPASASRPGRRVGQGGGTLASAFGSQPLLPDLALQMIEVGEQAGELDSMLLEGRRRVRR